MMAQASASQLPFLPRELVDVILSELILLCNDNPAYQWTRLRHITRYCRAQIEEHFRDFWVPKLTLTFTDADPGMHVTFSKHDVNTARFTARHVKEPHEWLVDDNMEDLSGDLVLRLTRNQAILDRAPSSRANILFGGQSDEAMQVASDEEPDPTAAVVTLGEGFLNKGYTKCGIISHISRVPGLKWDEHTEEFYLHWKPLLTQLLGEELLMRRFRDALLETFLPTLETTMSEEERHKATHTFLRDRYQLQRRKLLSTYRTHIICPPFDITPFLTLPKPAEEDYSSLDLIFLREESIVFQIPGISSFGIREVAKLRISEEPITEQMLSMVECGLAGEEYLEAMREREAQMSGKAIVDEDVLEEWLKDDALEPGRFWDW
jgi:hypothetical protein